MASEPASVRAAGSDLRVLEGSDTYGSSHMASTGPLLSQSIAATGRPSRASDSKNDITSPMHLGLSAALE